MKVLILNDFSTIVGGAERFLDNLLQEPHDSAFEFHRLDIAELFKINYTDKVHQLRERFERIHSNPEIIRTISAKIAEIQPDLIQLNNNNLFTNSVTRSLSHFNIPVLAFIHDHYALKRIQSVFYARPADRYIYLTHSTDIYRRLLDIKKRVFLVKVPFNHQKWSHANLLNDSRSKIDLLYVGRIERNKGIFKLIRAIEKIKRAIPSITLVIVGEGSQRSAAEKMVLKKNLNSNIKLMGLQRDPELLQYYCNSKMLLFPSSGETLGYVGLEAQACGTPVIAFSNQGTIRWCKDYQNGFIVEKGNAQRLAEKVMEIIDDEVLLKRISKTAMEHIAEEKYNASTQAVTDIYKAIHPW